MDRLRYAGLLAAAFLGSMVGSYLLSPQDTVQARAKDAEFASVSVRSLKLVDKNGKTKAQLFNNKEKGATFAIYDDMGNHRAALSTVSGGVPEVGLYDSNGNARALMSLDKKAWPHLILNDSDEDAVWMAPGYNLGVQGERPLTEKERWESLKKGMTKRQVLELLGNPECATFGGTVGLTWHWGIRAFAGTGVQSDGSVVFRRGTVASWDSPYDGR